MPGVSEAEETLSSEEKMALAQRLLQQSPPGEFADVLQDICAILNNDDRLMAQLHEAVRERNLHSGTIVTVPLDDGQSATQGERHGNDDTDANPSDGDNVSAVKVPLTTFNELPDGQFFDPDTGTVFAVNHYNLEVENIDRAADEDGAATPRHRQNDPLRLALKEELRGYMRQTLPQGFCQVFGPTEASEYAILMVGERFQLRNMRNGQWHSLWTLQVDTAAIRGQGSIRVIVHYFEDGNVQLQAQRQCDFSLEATPVASLARDIVERIRERENEVQLAINESYSQLADSTFKKLRRQLPVTRAKVDWTKLASYKVGDQLAGPPPSVPTEATEAS